MAVIQDRAFFLTMRLFGLAFAVVLLKSMPQCAAISCMECNDLPSPAVCGKVTTCHSNSSCLVREYITSSGATLFASGCVSDQRCRYLHGRQVAQGDENEDSNDLDACFECCNDRDYCNIEGCGRKDTEISHRGPYCFECPVENDVFGCRSTRPCDIGYACSISKSSFPGMYKTGCVPTTVCNQANQFADASASVLLGKRDDPDLYIPLPYCCQTDFCNDILLFATNATMAVDGIWSPWSQWTTCSKTCGYGGHQTRSRACDNPPPQNNGSYCHGNATEGRDCMTTSCPVDGRWSLWSTWSTCTVLCGPGGQETRTRNCDSPAPQHNGVFCQGSHIETQNCSGVTCPVDGGWSHWGHWSACSKTCGGGHTTRTRHCNNPAPQHNGAVCLGTDKHVSRCQTPDCPVDGRWSVWGVWSTCSKTCGGGDMTRARHCNNPAPQNNGAFCHGNDKETHNCQTQQCPEEACRAHGYSMVHVPETSQTLCLKLSGEPRTWFYARTVCQSDGGDLVTVDSQPVDNAISHFLRGKIHHDEDLWTGLFESHDRWHWVKSSVPFSYHRFEHHHHEHDHVKHGDCGLVEWYDHGNSGWYSEPCVDRYRYLCEIHV